ncbi:Enoyl reductase (ER) domain-containing protein [Madurella fahalii]|uniref:Enoyl reductase (ER) domain-containing protein n=1 Tax=Madurella fahalii TaxID=1157608 RepID=A0ABQ0G0Q0_9PEZI
MSSLLLPSVPPTHPAVAITAGPRQPLKIIQLPTLPPAPAEALIHVTWTSSTPLDLHRADGGLLIDTAALATEPFIMGGSFGGTVVALGPTPAGSAPCHLSVGDAVFGFTQDGLPAEATFQTYITVPTYKVSKLPAGLALREAVTAPTNLVTAVHTLTHDLGLALPWPLPDGWAPAERDHTVLVWGAASSVGMYVLQVLRHWGYRNVLGVASAKHHALLKGLGAKECFDYREPGVVERILEYVDRAAAAGAAEGKKSDGPKVPFIVDCIGSREGTLRPLSKIAERGSKVAVMMPVINVHAREDQVPEYEMDINKVLVGEWKEGVELLGTRTFFYARNEFLKDHLQPEIIPALLEQGVVKPNPQRVIEGKTLLERAENALSVLRNQAQSGEKLVWRVADDEDSN